MIFLVCGSCILLQKAYKGLTSQESVEELQARKGSLVQAMAPKKAGSSPASALPEKGPSQFNIENFSQDDEEALLAVVVGTPKYDFDAVLEALVAYALIEKVELKVPDDPLVEDALGHLVEAQVQRIEEVLKEAKLTDSLEKANLTEEMKELAIKVTGAQKYDEGELAKALVTIGLRHVLESAGTSSGGYAGSSADSKPDTAKKGYKFGDVTKHVHKAVTGKDYEFGDISKKAIPLITEQLTGEKYKFGDLSKWLLARRMQKSKK